MSLASVVVFLALQSNAFSGPPEVEGAYRKLFAHFVDERTLGERFLNEVGLSSRDVGRSFAVVAGVSKYPNLGQSELAPAAEDIRKFVDYLKNVERFDEIVVLQNSDMSAENLTFFLQSYFPDRLKQFPKSRFLFAYTGHGFNDGIRGYLLGSRATSFQDKRNSVNLMTLKVLMDEVVDSGYQVLVLINSCYSGAFLSRQPFGDSASLLPRNPGAHAITAGGSRELAWHDERFGSGSIFFEKLLAGLDGRADRYPNGGDGIVTVEEIYAYLRAEIQVSTDQHQNPQLGDITRNGALGGFFFFNRRPLIARGALIEWQPSLAKAFSSELPRPMPPTNVTASLGDSDPAGIPNPIVPQAGVHESLFKFSGDRSFTLRMVDIPAGEYRMGDALGLGSSWERPVHDVKIKPFAMSTSEITFNQYDVFAQETGWGLPPDDGFGRGDRPVRVAWLEAIAFAQWISRLSGLQFRLPSESEWEYAARARTTSRFYWGNEFSHSNANIGRVHDSAIVVASFPANGFGLYDMIGNQNEWTQDCRNDSYLRAPNDGSPWLLGDCKFRVARGGSYAMKATDVSASTRFMIEPTIRMSGFRIVQGN